MTTRGEGVEEQLTEGLVIFERSARDADIATACRVRLRALGAPAPTRVGADPAA